MQIARPFGIPLRLHWSFWLLVAGIVGYFCAELGSRGFVPGLVLSTGLVTSVVLHELGHALAARRFGVHTHHITLYPMGGVAAMEEIPEDPHQEMVIAFAGPAVNFVLVAVGGWLYLGTSSPYALLLAMMNLAMGVFNLLPAYPMDGGRILRSLLARRMGWLPASRAAVRIGRGFAWAFIGIALVFGNINLGVVGVFLHLALNAEHKRLVALHWERTTGRPAPWEQRNAPTTAPPSLSPTPGG